MGPVLAWARSAILSRHNAQEDTVTAVDEEQLQVGPPGSVSKFTWSGVPYWLIGIMVFVAFIALQVVTQPRWRDGFEFIVNGLSLTLLVTLGGFIIAMVLGLLIGLARLSSNVVLQNVSQLYIELIRGIPVIVTILIVTIVLFGQVFERLPEDFERFRPSFAIRGTIALGLIYAAFIAEVFRAGIQSISIGQREAGASIGLSRRQVMRKVVFPQAIRNIMPALGNDLIALLKDSALVSIIAVRELTQMTRLWTGRSFAFIEGYGILTMFYLILVIGLSLLLRWYEKRIQIPGY